MEKKLSQLEIGDNFFFLPCLIITKVVQLEIKTSGKGK